MIRINLLPVRVSRAREAAISQLIGAGLGLVAVVLVCVFVYLSQSSEIEAATLANDQLAKDIEHQKQVIGQVEEFTKKKEGLEKKLGIIDTLKAQKTGPVHMLDEIASNIPEKCWLTSLSELNRKVTLTGVAVNNEVIADFISKLERSGYFDDVYLVSTQQKEDKDGLKLKEFQVTANMTTPAEKKAAGRDVAVTSGEDEIDAMSSEGSGTSGN